MIECSPDKYLICMILWVISRKIHDRSWIFNSKWRTFNREQRDIRNILARFGNVSSCANNKQIVHNSIGYFIPINNTFRHQLRLIRRLLWYDIADNQRWQPAQIFNERVKYPCHVFLGKKLWKCQNSQNSRQ